MDVLLLEVMRLVTYGLILHISRFFLTFSRAWEARTSPTVVSTDLKLLLAQLFYQRDINLPLSLTSFCFDTEDRSYSLIVLISRIH